MDIVLKDVGSEKNNLNQIFSSIIHPARPKDIEKYMDQDTFLVRESAELYEKVTKPFILAQVNTGNLQWVYNILEHKAEVTWTVGSRFLLVIYSECAPCRWTELFMRKI